MPALKQPCCACCDREVTVCLTVRVETFTNARHKYIRLGLRSCLKRLCRAHVQMAELERQAEHMVEVESRAEVAEGERDAALDRMQLMTPRPALPPSIELPSTLGPEGSAKFLAALNKFRYIPSPSSHASHRAPHGTHEQGDGLTTSFLVEMVRKMMMTSLKIHCHQCL